MYLLQKSPQSVLSHHVLIPYCNVIFLQIIMLGGIRTGWIFREKADCKQFSEIRPLVLQQGLTQGVDLKAPSGNLYPPNPGPVL